MKPVRVIGPVVALALFVAMVSGCQTVQKPQYARPLPPGSFGLRKITDPAKLPDLTPVAQQADSPSFKQALHRSLTWFGINETKAFFPVGPITHKQAWASVYAMGQMPQGTTAQRIAWIKRNFDVWQSVGWNGRGIAFFTGYYSPVFDASKVRTGAYQYPLYKRPADLVTNPTTGKVLGRRTSAGIVPYPTRKQIEQSDMLAGHELVWLKSRLDAYIVQVNGSAKLRMRNGSIMYVGYAGSNGRAYVSVGHLLAQNGKVDKNRLSLSSIRDYFQAHPGELEHYLEQNPRFVFFKKYSSSAWPAGSLGFKVTPMRTLATDKSIFPRGCPVLVQTWMPSSSMPGAAQQPFYQLMLDQDTGGAIRAAGRADIYVGVGDQAQTLAGQLAAEGRFYYLLLKPDKVNRWFNRMQSSPGATAAGQAGPS